VTNGTNYDTNLTIKALAGGTINLSAATQIVDPAAGDQNYRAINVSADGAGSVVNLAAVTSFVDNYAGSSTGGNRFSTLTATRGGTVQAPLLATLTGVAVTLDGTGSLATAQLTALTTDAVTLSGAAAYDFSG